MLTDNTILGTITIKLEVLRVDDPGGIEEAPYSYLVVANPELLESTLSDSTADWLGHELLYGEPEDYYTLNELFPVKDEEPTVAPAPLFDFGGAVTR